MMLEFSKQNKLPISLTQQLPPLQMSILDTLDLSVTKMLLKPSFPAHFTSATIMLHAMLKHHLMPLNTETTSSESRF